MTEDEFDECNVVLTDDEITRRFRAWRATSFFSCFPWFTLLARKSRKE